MVGACAMPAMVRAQDAAVQKFEVVTVKPSDPKDGSSNLGFNQSRHFITRNSALMPVVLFAYGLNMGSKDQVIGAPGWLSTALFDIDAKPDDAMEEKMMAMPIEERMNAVRPMIQALLEDRFKLKVHHETREMQVNVLEVTKGGARMTPSSDKPEDKSWQGLHVDSAGHMEGKQATMEMLSQTLGHMAEVGGRMVVDKTELTGKYDFDLHWTPGSQNDPGPSLFTAMQETMGLRLTSAKEPVDVIVIDSVEKPTEN